MDKNTEKLLATVVVVSSLSTAIGAFVGWGLSVTAFSPLAIGGIVAAISVILLTANICIFHNGRMPSKQEFSIAACICLISAAIGVGLAAVATAISPGIMIGAKSAALAGAVIGAIAAIAPIAGLFVIDKVSDHIISPIIEHFSSKKEYEPV